MSKICRFTSFVAITALLALLLQFATVLGAVNGTLPSVSGKSAILMEKSSHTVIYQKNADVKLPMASTTKIMTAIVALEQVEPSLIVSVPASAVGIEGSSVYLYEGEKLSMEDLLYALLLESANDAATAIAITVAGSVEAFAELMNQKAASIGMTNTHFTNPHGLDNDEHYTTAYDMALLAAYCLDNATFSTIVATKRKTIPLHDTEGVRLLLNHNRLLRTYEGTVGLKTGYTKRSGRCLVSACVRDGVCLIAVTINAPDDWNDHMQMFDYGFANYESVRVAEKEALCFAVPVIGGVEAVVSVTNPTEICVAMRKNHGEIRQSVELPRWTAPTIEQGQQLGRVVYTCDGEEIAEVPLVATKKVDKKRTKQGIFQRIVAFFRLFNNKS